MNKICLAAVSGAALLGLANLANAQGTETGTGAGTGSAASGSASNQCWDVSTNMVRDKSSAGAAASGSTGSTASDTSTTGAAGAGAAGSAGSASGSPTAAARPAGMPNC
jgi:hypothetical protein